MLIAKRRLFPPDDEVVVALVQYTWHVHPMCYPACVTDMSPVAHRRVQSRALSLLKPGDFCEMMFMIHCKVVTSR